MFVWLYYIKSNYERKTSSILYDGLFLIVHFTIIFLRIENFGNNPLHGLMHLFPILMWLYFCIIERKTPCDFFLHIFYVLYLIELILVTKNGFNVNCCIIIEMFRFRCSAFIVMRIIDRVTHDHTNTRVCANTNGVENFSFVSVNTIYSEGSCL